MDDRRFPTANDLVINQQAWEVLPDHIASKLRQVRNFDDAKVDGLARYKTRLGWLQDLSENSAVRVALTRYYPIHHHGVLELVVPGKPDDDGKRLITLFPLTQDIFRVTYEYLRQAGSIRKGHRLGLCNTAALPEMLRQTEKAIDRLIAETSPDQERQSL